MGCCPLCNLRELQHSNNISKQKGLVNCTEIKCLSACNFLFTTYTTNRVSKSNQSGPDPFDINARSVIDFREIGRGILPCKPFPVIWIVNHQWHTQHIGI